MESLWKLVRGIFGVIVWVTQCHEETRIYWLIHLPVCSPLPSMHVRLTSSIWFIYREHKGDSLFRGNHCIGIHPLWFYMCVWLSRPLIIAVIIGMLPRNIELISEHMESFRTNREDFYYFKICSIKNHCAKHPFPENVPLELLVPFVADSSEDELVNPCYSGNHDCDTTAQCIPLEGLNFRCQCATGYRGDGHNCYGNAICFSLLFVLVDLHFGA